MRAACPYQIDFCDALSEFSNVCQTRSTSGIDAPICISYSLLHKQGSHTAESSAASNGPAEDPLNLMRLTPSKGAEFLNGVPVQISQP